MNTTPRLEDSQTNARAGLELVLDSIAEERRRKSKLQKVQQDVNYIHIPGIFWTHLFCRHFIESKDGDDMLFFVRKFRNCTYGEDEEQVEVDVYRKQSKKLPSLADSTVDWEQTVYLNLILQQFVYTLTCAVCTRTGPQELQVLKKHTMQVYASPSKRQMQVKGEEEEITYPNIYFSVDNFDEVFNDITVRDSEMVCVELVASDKGNRKSGVIFLGSIRYDALKKVYDNRTSTAHRLAQRVSLGWYKGNQRMEFVRMRGPHSKGHAEMAVSKDRSDFGNSRSVSAPVTPCLSPTHSDATGNFNYEEFAQYSETTGVAANQQQQYTDRRMSDPSASLDSILKGFGKHSNMKKVLSSSKESIDVDVGDDGGREVEAGDIREELTAPNTLYNRMLGRGFGQAWHWLKERRRANSMSLNSYLTYITLPWNTIMEDILESKQMPILTF